MTFCVIKHVSCSAKDYAFGNVVAVLGCFSHNQYGANVFYHWPSCDIWLRQMTSKTTRYRPNSNFIPTSKTHLLCQKDNHEYYQYRPTCLKVLSVMLDLNKHFLVQPVRFVGQDLDLDLHSRHRLKSKNLGVWSTSLDSYCLRKDPVISKVMGTPYVNKQSCLSFVRHFCSNIVHEEKGRMTDSSDGSSIASQLGSEFDVPSVESLRTEDLAEQEMSDLEMNALTADKENFEPTMPGSVQELKELSLPELSRIALNIVPYVGRSKTLQNLVKLGVDLAKVQKVKGMAELLLKSDFDRDIMPYLQFLANVGVTADKLGHVLSVNPKLLMESLEDMEARVGYLLSKRFTLPEVASIFMRSPVTILMSPIQIDEKLGFLQDAFELSGKEVRQVALTYPKLLPWQKEKIANIRFRMKEFLGFDNDDMKLMILREPKLFVADIHKVTKTFDYLYNTMLIPRQQLILWPAIIRQRLFKIKERHLFLLHVGRAQYDPTLENYVSMKKLVSESDADFCKDIAKSDVKEFYGFLKTL